MANCTHIVAWQQALLFPQSEPPQRVQNFIAVSRKVHGDKYDYSLVDDKTWPMVKVICPVHGVFAQTQFNHRKGCGCDKCSHETLSQKLRLSQTEFLERIHQLYGDQYDTTYAIYTNNRTKVKLICKKHGEFWIAPDKLFAGAGCQVCGIESRTNRLRMSREDFICKAVEIHGSRYDYSRVVYKNTKTKVEVVCLEHGPFWVAPNNHIFGGHNGCPRCAGIERGNMRRLTTEHFIQAARQVHGNKYDYSKAKYISAKTNVTVICPEHGEFQVTPDNHIRGETGCLTCLASNGEKEVAEILTDLGITFTRQKRFKECRYKRELPFDFCIEENKQIILIEFDGMQHYKPWVPGRNSRRIREDSKLEVVQKRDQIKDAFAAAHNIPLIRVPYTVKDRRAYLVERLAESGFRVRDTER